MAQPESDLPLQGKKVGVYFSRKNFFFEDLYNIPLGQFVMADQGRNIDIEDLKSQTLISLGTLFCDQLPKAVQADSVVFLNKEPELGQAFMQAYDADTHKLEAGALRDADLDYVMVINPLYLGAYKTTSVYTVSNRLVTEAVYVKTGRIRLDVYDPNTGELRYIAEACMDERYSSIPQMLFEFHMENSATGIFLSKLFSLGVLHLNLGVRDNCD